MPRARDTRMVAMDAGQLWQLVCDPWQLPRWWPRVERVEGVKGGHFTEMLRSPGGKLLRADFEVTTDFKVTRQDQGEMRIGWTQQIAGTPFAHVFSAIEVEVEVRSSPGVNANDASEVTLTLTQRLKGWSSRMPVTRREGSTRAMWTGTLGRLGHPIIARAAVKTVKEALDGLQRLAA